MAVRPDGAILVGPLPPGRHRLAREAVAASQRARLLAALTEVVAERGYGETTVGHVVARAGVSRRTFYEHFSSRQECFLAAYDAGTEKLIRAIAGAVSGRQGWSSRLRAGIEAYLETLAASPGFAHLFVQEIGGAGDPASERRRAVHRRFVRLYRELNASALAEDPGVRTVGDEELMLVVGGTEQLVADHLQRGSVDGIPALAPAIVRAVSSLLLASEISWPAARAGERGQPSSAPG
jgi:AcrR family transcriptional regulator